MMRLVLAVLSLLGGAAWAWADSEAELTAGLAQVSSSVPFTLVLESADGRRFEYHRGDSSATKVYESASTSKWVSAAVVLRLVDQGKLSLGDVPSRHLANWPRPGQPLGDVTLAQLLSFTSGLEHEPLAMNLGGADFFDVVGRIATQNRKSAHGPGEAFFYASTHLQVAGAMAVRAAGAASWAEVFENFRHETGLFPHSSFDLPSATNPRLAGGMHWTAEDYLEFLKAYRDGKVLSASLRDTAVGPQTTGAIQAHSPVVDDLGETWAYGFGLWVEPGTDRVSSPGAYGAYPFWDKKLGFVGILARQGRLGTYPEGIRLERAVRPLIEAWAAHP